SANINRKITAIGTGPFMAATDYEYRVGIKLRRNPDYWVSDERGNRFPYLDGVQLALIPDFAAALAAFRTGKIDQGVALVGATQVRGLMKTNPTTLVQERNAGPSTLAIGVGFRLDKEPWKDVRVRRALSLTIDYEALAQTVVEVPYFGASWISGAWYGQPSNSLEVMTKECGCPWYQGPDVKRAKALLAEAGYPNGFTTTLEYFPYNSVYTPTYEFMSFAWAEIGAIVKLKTLDLTIYRPNLEKGAWTDLSLTFLNPPPASIYAAVQHFVPGQGANPITGWVNDPKMTAWVKEFNASYKDDAKQKDIARQMRAYYMDQVITIPEPLGRTYGILAPRLRNYQPATGALITSDFRGTMFAWIDDDWAFNK
ncbi:MAG: ABC transporter substrate-binding protein, partial [Dehalococcoidia bacterium]|nr:ABC transporter substrate-binding protein [Dehalococcoidia bacterium]